jgi:hypothetical protein
MERIEEILITLITAGMRREQMRLIPHFNAKRIGLEGQVRAGGFDGHRIAVGFKRHLAVRVQRHRQADATSKVTVGQDLQVRCFLGEGRSDRPRPAIGLALFIGSRRANAR